MSSDAEMSRTIARRLPVIVIVLWTLMLFDIVALFLSAVLHSQGLPIPLGPIVVEEPQIVPAAVLEGLISGTFSIATYLALSGRRGAWSLALVAHVFAILILLLGISVRRDGASAFNQISQLVLLGVFVIGLALLATPAVRATMGHDRRST